MTPDDEGYRGPATLTVDDVEVPCEVILAGYFEPLAGKYRWYGRVVPSEQLTELMSGGARTAVLTTPHASVETTLSDVDPWGRPRVGGFGAAPFEVADSVDSAE